MAAKLLPSDRAKGMSFKELRQAAIVIYGGCCVQCGDTEDLEFDHVLTDGKEHRREEDGRKMFRRIVVLGRPLPDRQLQLLCMFHHTEKTRLESRSRALLQRRK